MLTTGQKIKRAFDVVLTGGVSTAFAWMLHNGTTNSIMMNVADEMKEGTRIWPQETAIWRQMAGFEHVAGIFTAAYAIGALGRASSAVQSLSHVARGSYYGAVGGTFLGIVFCSCNLYIRAFTLTRDGELTGTVAITAIPIRDYVLRGVRKENKLLFGTMTAFPDEGATIGVRE